MHFGLISSSYIKSILRLVLTVEWEKVAIISELSLVYFIVTASRWKRIADFFSVLSPRQTRNSRKKIRSIKVVLARSLVCYEMLPEVRDMLLERVSKQRLFLLFFYHSSLSFPARLWWWLLLADIDSDCTFSFRNSFQNDAFTFPLMQLSGISKVIETIWENGILLVMQSVIISLFIIIYFQVVEFSHSGLKGKMADFVSAYLKCPHHVNNKINNKLLLLLLILKFRWMRIIKWEGEVAIYVKRLIWKKNPLNILDFSLSVILMT